MTDIRLFSLDEAERTLPLLRRILADLRVEHATWRDALADYELLAANARADRGESAELVIARSAMTAAAERVNGFIQEIEALGVLFKGYEEGLVDFYALRDDRLVLLCWKDGEDHITHWHDVDAGFAGRQPIDAAAFSGILP